MSDTQLEGGSEDQVIVVRISCDGELSMTGEQFIEKVMTRDEVDGHKANPKTIKCEVPTLLGVPLLIV
jgi:hypothetical protein